jgi:succinate dehydrogenase / fumarate reductase membrane anchor subunit
VIRASALHFTHRLQWLWQRLSAAYIAIYSVAMLVLLGLAMPLTHESWRDLMGSLLIRATSALFFLSVALHAFIGVQDILVDYVGGERLRLGLQLVLLGAVLYFTGHAISILWRL